MADDTIAQIYQPESIKIPTDAMQVFVRLWELTFSSPSEYIMSVTPPAGWSIAITKEQGVPNLIIGIATMLDPTLAKSNSLLSSISEAGNLQGHENLRLAVFRYSDKVDGSETTRIELAFHNHRIMVHLFEDGVVSFERHIIDSKQKEGDNPFILIDAQGSVIENVTAMEEVRGTLEMFNDFLDILGSVTKERQYA